MRDDDWLKNKLLQLHQNHFPDIIEGNEIEVRFGRACKTRLGSIAIREKANRSRRLVKGKLEYLAAEEVVSIITINGHFTNEGVPEEVVDGVLAHEFSHFVHGFNSIRAKKYRLPHAGGIIANEMKSRGLDEILKTQKRWIKKNWKKYIENNNL